MLIDLLDLGARTGVILLPLSVGVLSFRRLILSTTRNSWLYGAMGLLSVFTVFALLPWAMLDLPIRPSVIGLAVALPPMWVGLVLFCGAGRVRPYDRDLDEDAASASSGLPTLVLENPVTEIPVFRHQAAPVPGHPPRASSNILTAARAMRGNPSSDPRRRPVPRKALPPPSPNLPFLRP